MCLKIFRNNLKGLTFLKCSLILQRAADGVSMLGTRVDKGKMINPPSLLLYNATVVLLYTNSYLHH